VEARTRALESLLIEMGIVTPEAIDEIVATYERDIGPLNGAKVVARAWSDPEFKRWLLEDATAAIAQMGFIGLGAENVIVVENTPAVHNVVVCTLCSCYPWSLLGLPPVWYKSPAYRSRMVIDPRGVLREFGLELDDSTEIRVWDSSAEIRQMVLPERPLGTESMTESELVPLVTRDAMIGVARVKAPTAAR
jgi:nitrile hydratase